MMSSWCHQMCMNEKVDQGPLYDINVWCNRSFKTKLHPIIVRQYSHLKYHNQLYFILYFQFPTCPSEFPENDPSIISVSHIKLAPVVSQSFNGSTDFEPEWAENPRRGSSIAGLLYFGTNTQLIAKGILPDFE